MAKSLTNVNDVPQKDMLALLAIGSNQSSVAGGPEKTVLNAIQVLKKQGFKVQAVSRLYTTLAFPKGSGPDFVNAAVAIVTKRSAEEILLILHQIEAELGRKRVIRWGPRTVDLDLLAVEDQIRPDRATQDFWRRLPLAAQTQQAPDQLILPHPRLQDRSFVLVPLADVAPDWRHPILGLTVQEMLAALSEEDKKAVKSVE